MTLRIIAAKNNRVYPSTLTNPEETTATPRLFFADTPSYVLIKDYWLQQTR